jgi:Peptidase family M1 domain
MTRRFCAAIMLSLFSPLLFAACSAAEPPAVLRQEIVVTLLPESHEVVGESTVTFRSGGARRLAFSLAPGATGLRCAVAGSPVPFTFAGGLLTVELPAAGDGTASLTVTYRCVFADRPPERPVSDEDPTYGVSGAVFREGVFLGPGAGWYPAPAVIPARRTVRISAPAGIEAVTMGRRTARGTTGGVTSSVWEETRPAGALALAAGPYLVEERQLDGLPLYTYFTRDNAHLAGRYLDAAAGYIRFYAELFGPYPFEKFAVVENFFPTGFGFPSFALLGGTVLRLPFIPQTSLPHEIAHSWWGNGVLIDYREGNWAEGLVTYLADYLLEERKSKAAGREYRLRLLTDYAALASPDRQFPLRRFTERASTASRAVGYGKGAMVFHMARRLVGDEAFFRALREIFREKLFMRASWSDFLGAFGRLSGKDFASFREEWLTWGGGPRLALAGVTRKAAGQGWTVTGEVVQTPPTYGLSLPIALETAGGVLRQNLPVEGERTPFAFTVPTEPERLVLDPEIDIFRLLSPAEVPPTVNRLKGSDSLLVIVTDRCRADRETLGLLLESLGQMGREIIGERGTDASGLAGHDLLFCGPPELPDLAPPAAGVTMTRQGFTIEGQTFDRPEDALFFVTRHPADRERVAALFYPLSAGAAAKAVPKITHYGKYGYLGFSAGENRRKGLAPVAARESSVIFAGGGGR